MKLEKEFTPSYKIVTTLNHYKKANIKKYIELNIRNKIIYVNRNKVGGILQGKMLLNLKQSTNCNSISK